MAEYVLDNAGLETEQRFESLESCWDPVTIAHLERIGVAPGWSCLEVGAGGGSIGAWLGARVGADGTVLVTDIDLRWIAGTLPPNVEVLRHDIVSEQLDAGRFDLVHARLVLLHLPERDRVLAKMARALKPGGWLLIEDFDCTWLPFAPDGIELADRHLFVKVADAFHEVLEQGGVEISHGRGFHRWFRSHGLTNVHVDGHMQISQGGSSGALLWQANIEQVGPRLVRKALLSEFEIERFSQLVADPTFSVNSYLLVSGRGQRAPAPPSARVPLRSSVRDASS
jgi:SAM-dependent methyltransferase